MHEASRIESGCITLTWILYVNVASLVWCFLLLNLGAFLVVQSSRCCPPRSRQLPACPYFFFSTAFPWWSFPLALNFCSELFPVLKKPASVRMPVFFQGLPLLLWCSSCSWVQIHYLNPNRRWTNMCFWLYKQFERGCRWHYCQGPGFSPISCSPSFFLSLSKDRGSRIFVRTDLLLDLRGIYGFQFEWWTLDVVNLDEPWVRPAYLTVGVHGSMGLLMPVSSS